MKIIKPFAKDYVMSAPFGISSKYFNRKVMHYGVDFACPEGTELLAISDGVIENVKKSYTPYAGYGKTVSLRCKNQKYLSFFAHCSDVLVKKGQNVLQGQIIAFSGATGFCVSSFVGGKGAHLHWGLKRLDEWVDPLIYLSDHERINFDVPGEDIEIEETIKIKDIENCPETDGEDEDNYYYLVKKGDSLSKIAKDFYGDGNLWAILHEMNEEIIVDPNKIFPNQKIKIPKNVEYIEKTADQ